MQSASGCKMQLFHWKPQMFYFSRLKTFFSVNFPLLKKFFILFGLSSAFIFFSKLYVIVSKFFYVFFFKNWCLSENQKYLKSWFYKNHEQHANYNNFVFIFENCNIYIKSTNFRCFTRNFVIFNVLTDFVFL